MRIAPDQISRAKLIREIIILQRPYFFNFFRFDMQRHKNFTERNMFSCVFPLDFETESVIYVFLHQSLFRRVEHFRSVTFNEVCKK